MADPSSSHLRPICPDWVLATNSNVHVANDRAWFTSYTPFESRLHSPYHSSEPVKIEGIGTVELITKRDPFDADSHTTLRLENVLFVPSLLCNVISLSGSKESFSDVQMGFGASDVGCNGKIFDKERRCVAYFELEAPLFQVKLWQPPGGCVFGDTVFKEGGNYLIGARWRDEEVKRWMADKTVENVQNGREEEDCSLYTEEEKR